MIIECPKCKSTFSVANKIATSNFSNFKCSICDHIWKINESAEKQKLEVKQKTSNNYYYVVMLNLAILVIVVIALFVFKDKLIYSNNFWNSFYDFFLNLIPVK